MANNGVRIIENTCVWKIAYKDVTTTENTGVRKTADNGLGK